MTTPTSPSSEDLRQAVYARFTEAEISVYKQHFDMFDLNGDGVISARELEKVSIKMGYRLNKKDVKEIMQAADLDKDGKLSFVEFVLAMPGNSAVPDQEHRIAEVRRKFMEYDVDGNGFVSVSEAHIILKTEFAFTQQQSTRLVKQYDKNGDGQLCYEEFADFYNTVCSNAVQVREIFHAFDRDHNGAISIDELRYMLRELNMPESKAEGLMKLYDKNKDGELQYKEFVAYLVNFNTF